MPLSDARGKVESGDANAESTTRLCGDSRKKKTHPPPLYWYTCKPDHNAFNL